MLTMREEAFGAGHQKELFFVTFGFFFLSKKRVKVSSMVLMFQDCRNWRLGSHIGDRTEPAPGFRVPAFDAKRFHRSDVSISHAAQR
jgi:hypothetical protein